MTMQESGPYVPPGYERIDLQKDTLRANDVLVIMTKVTSATVEALEVPVPEGAVRVIKVNGRGDVILRKIRE